MGERMNISKILEFHLQPTEKKLMDIILFIKIKFRLMRVRSWDLMNSCFSTSRGEHDRCVWLGSASFMKSYKSNCIDTLKCGVGQGRKEFREFLKFYER